MKSESTESPKADKKLSRVNFISLSFFYFKQNEEQI